MDRWMSMNDRRRKRSTDVEERGEEGGFILKSSSLCVRIVSPSGP